MFFKTIMCHFMKLLCCNTLLKDRRFFPWKTMINYKKTYVQWADLKECYRVAFVVLREMKPIQCFHTTSRNVDRLVHLRWVVSYPCRVECQSVCNRAGSIHYNNQFCYCFGWKHGYIDTALKSKPYLVYIISSWTIINEMPKK